MTVLSATPSYRGYFLASIFLFVGWFSTSTTAQTAIATCPPDTSSADNYRAQVTGLNPTERYTIIVDGVVTQDSVLIPSGEYESDDIPYTDGTGVTLVRVVLNPGIFFDTTDFEVHELLCTDIDFDGDFDFSEGTCDYTTPGLDYDARGTIISTVAPYLGDQVYKYVLTDTAGLAISVNNTGLFTGLGDGEYNVFAFTFLDLAEANQLIDSITFGVTDMDGFSVTQPACYGFCGDVKGKTGSFYEIDCELEIVADPVEDQEVCNGGDAEFYVESTINGPIPPLTTTSYAWLVDSTGTGYVDISDGGADSILSLTSLDTIEDGNLYKGIAILYVNGVEIDRDTSGAGTLTIFDDATLAANMDTTVSSGATIGVVFTDGSSNADSFVITAINIPAVVGLTAGAGNASIGSTVNASAIAADTYTNDTGVPQTISYTVTPYTSNDCDGDPVTILVTISPCPEVDAIAATVCSDDITGVTLPSADVNGATIDSFSITANSAGATTGLVTDLSSILNDTYNNTTPNDSIVVYTITPYAYGCAGSSFTVTVTVEPEPAINDMTFTACSDSPIDVDLLDITTYVGTGPTVDSFVVTAVASGVSGTPTEGTLTTVDGIANDEFTNTTTSSGTVTYTVIPYAGECAGESYTVTVTITAEPVGVDPELEVCSDEPYSVTIQDLISNGLTLDSIAWFVETANQNANLVGVPTDTSHSATLSGVLSNVSGSSQDLVYTIVTYSGTCAGDRFSVTVTVNPEPVFDDVAETVCSEEEFDITLGDSQTDAAGILGYTYTVNSPGTGRTDTTTANITASFSNTTNTDIVLTYVVTPISIDSCAGEPFNVVVTIQPEPVLATDLDDTVCSNSAIGVVLDTTATSTLATSYDIVSIDGNGLTNTATTAAATGVTTDINAIASDQWENTSTAAVDVTYKIAPISVNGCIGDTVDVVITIDPEAVVEAGSYAGPLCSNYDLTLSELGASITGGSSTGTWSSSGTGTFVDGSDDPANSLAGAVTYKPSLADKQSGGVTLTLTASAEGTCTAELEDTVFISINNVSCSEFPWNGN